MKINIPEMLVRLRAQDVEKNHPLGGRVPTSQLDVALAGASWMMSDGARMEAVERGLPLANVASPKKGLFNLPGVAGEWTRSRDIPAPPKESFRSWWRKNRGEDN